MNLADVRKNFWKIVNELYKDDGVILQKNGKPVAALIDILMFENIKKLKEQFIYLSNKLS